MIKRFSCCLLIFAALPVLADNAYTEELFQLYCHSCHGIQGSGAPLAFSSKEWRPYLRKGSERMLNNTITGVGNMPALGTCQECGPEELRNLIQYMSQTEE